MSKEMMRKLKQKKELYRMWKKGQATWKEYRSVLRICRKAKACLVFNLSRGVMDKKN